MSKPKFTLQFYTDNDAFVPDAGPEIARILRYVADRMERGADRGVCHDINGNAVGEFAYRE